QRQRPLVEDHDGQVDHRAVGGRGEVAVGRRVLQRDAVLRPLAQEGPGVARVAQDRGRGARRGGQLRDGGRETLEVAVVDEVIPEGEEGGDQGVLRLGGRGERQRRRRRVGVRLRVVRD